MSIPILVECKQDIPYFNYLKSKFKSESKSKSNGEDVPLVMISKPQSDKDISIRDIMKYHKYIPQSLLYKTNKSSIYINKGITFDEKMRESSYIRWCLGTESDITLEIPEAKFWLCTKETYDALTVARLLSNNTLILMEKPDDQDLYYFYKESVLICESNEIEDQCNRLNNLNSTQIKTEVSNLKPLDNETIHQLPLSIQPKYHNELIIDEPEDRFQHCQCAETHLDNDNNQVLTLSITDGAESLPNITVIITTPSEEMSIIASEMIRLNKSMTKYPSHHIEYIQQQGEETLRDAVERASNDIISIMTPHTYYLPHSLYAKVKLLLDHSEYNLIGTHRVAYYHLYNDRSYCVRTKYPDISSIAFRKGYFLQYPKITDATEYLYKNRYYSVCDLPFIYNCINIDISQQQSIEAGAGVQLIQKRLFDWEVKHTMVQLYRKLTKINS